MLRTATPTTIRSTHAPEHPEVDTFVTSSPSPPGDQYTVHINLIPLTDSVDFSPKQLTFTPAQEIKIGRVSASRNQRDSRSDNGVFECDVMSREHAVLKEDGGKITIKDLKSTHGTFINSIRLGDGLEDSEWKILNHNDILAFGHNVRRNQLIYQHLSARVFYPEGIVNTNNITNEQNFTDNITETVTSDDVENLVNQNDDVIKNQIIIETTSITNESININEQPNQKKDVEKIDNHDLLEKENIQIEQSSSLLLNIDTTNDTYHEPKKDMTFEKNIVSGVEVRDKIEQTMVPSPTEDGHLPKHLLVDQKEQEVNQANSLQTDSINDASSLPGINDKVEVGSPEKPVTPAITPDHHPASPITETSTKDEDTASISTYPPPDIKIKENIASQIVQDSNQIYLSLNESINNSEHKDNSDNSDIDGEGPSILSQELEESVKLTTNRKRKYEDMKDGKDETDEMDLGNKSKEKEGNASKRMRLEILFSATVGFAVGATGVFLYYFSGN
nr:3235_t:CDS:2 [Entrophospora candida]CAG8511167.1 8853_t:CDS:2 [Entrophospora candida]